MAIQPGLPRTEGLPEPRTFRADPGEGLSQEDQLVTLAGGDLCHVARFRTSAWAIRSSVRNRETERLPKL